MDAAAWPWIIGAAFTAACQLAAIAYAAGRITARIEALESRVSELARALDRRIFERQLVPPFTELVPPFGEVRKDRLAV